MTRLPIRLQQAAEELLESAHAQEAVAARLIEMLADGRIDSEETRELANSLVPTLARATVAASHGTIEVFDVTGDLREASQTLAIGRQRTPNKHLRYFNEDIDRLREDHNKRASRLLSSRRPSENQAA